MKQLGDMSVMTDDLPAGAWRALAAISARLHQSYEAPVPGASSKDKCLFASLAARDFFVQIGFTDATVYGCAFYIEATDNTTGEQIWSIGVGTPGEPDIPDKFNGHAVVVVPKLQLLVDTTMYQVIRPHWGGAISGMMAVPYNVGNRMNDALFERPILTWADAILPDRTVSTRWLYRPELPWRQSEDYRIKNARRIAVTKAMLDAYYRSPSE